MIKLINILPVKTREERRADGGVYLSASQINTYTECPVKWAWDKLDKIPRPESTPAQKKGTKVHSILEEYLRQGTPPDPKTELGRIALAGIKYLPTPGLAEIEEEFAIECDVAKYVGFIDFSYMKEDMPIVGDHKTTGNLAWAKTPMMLRTDTQAILYAVYAIEKHKTDVVGLNWVYYRTKTHPESFLVSLELDREAVEREFLGIQGMARQMVQAHENNLQAKDLTPNPQSCNNYGGCEFLKRCIIEHPKWRETEDNSKRAKTAMEKLKSDGKSEDHWRNKRMSKISLTEKMALLRQKKADAAQPKTTETPHKSENVVSNVKKEDQTPEKASKSGMMLLIDCLPAKAETRCISIDDIARPVIDKLNEDCKEKGFKDYRLVEYNEGTKELCARMEEYINNADFSDRWVTLSTSSQLGRDLLDVFVKQASCIIKGIR